MAKEADKELKSVQDYLRKLNIVSTKGPQTNGSTEFIEEKADPQVNISLLLKKMDFCMNDISIAYNNILHYRLEGR